MKEPLKDAIPVDQLYPDDAKYLKGKENWMIRMYFYLQNGLNMLNDFHNIFLAMLTLAVTWKITNVFILASIGIPSLIIFIFIGYYRVHKYSKLQEWLSMRFGTHYGLKSFNFTQGNYESLVEIRDILRRMEEKNGA